MAYKNGIKTPLPRALVFSEIAPLGPPLLFLVDHADPLAVPPRERNGRSQRLMHTERLVIGLRGGMTPRKAARTCHLAQHRTGIEMDADCHLAGLRLASPHKCDRHIASLSPETRIESTRSFFKEGCPGA